MAPPTSYDPESLDEQPIPLPNAALLRISQNIVLQPPLSRRGTGPGIVIFLPNPAQVVFTDQSAPKPLDPDPIIKWAEEGFAVVAITGSNDLPSIVQALKEALEVLQTLEQVDVKQKFAVISEYHGQMHRRSSFFLIFFFFIQVYNPEVVYTVSEVVTKEPLIAAFVGYGSFPVSTCSTIPVMLHLATDAPPKPVADCSNRLTTRHFYPTSSIYFVLPQTTHYDPASASLAHSRTLVFLRRSLGGPFFDLEAIWDEHTYFEFEIRSVAKTMGTMVVSPFC